MASKLLKLTAGVAAIASVAIATSAHAELSAEDLAKIAQNPVGKLPVNTQLSAYYNVVTPDNGPNWQIRAQVQFMFPK